MSVLRSHHAKGLAILLARPSDSRGWRYIRAILYSDGLPDDHRVSDDDLSNHQTHDAHPDEEHRKPRRESILLIVELHLAPNYTFILVHRAFALRCFKLLSGQNTVLTFTPTPVIYLGLQYLSLAEPTHLLFVSKTCLSGFRGGGLRAASSRMAASRTAHVRAGTAPGGDGCGSLDRVQDHRQAGTGIAFLQHRTENRIQFSDRIRC